MQEEPKSSQENAVFDPYALDPSEIRQPPTTLGRALREMGPGLILAGSIVGTGELIQTTDLGGKVGFTLLWLVIFSCFIKVFVQIELGRHAIASGLTTLEAFRTIPVVGILFVWWWLLMTLVTLTQLAAMVDGVSQAVVRGVELLPWIERGSIGELMRLGCGALIALVTIALLVTGTYSVVQNVTMFLVCLFTLFTTLCVALLPFTEAWVPLSEILNGLIPKAPRFAWKEALSMFAITGVGASELLSYPYWCIEKGYARWTGPRSADGGWLERARGWMRVMRLDAWGSMVVYTIATVAFYVLGAAVLFSLRSGKGLGEGKELLPTLVAMYTPVLGDLGAHLIVLVGAIAVLFSTLFVASAGHARMTADFLYVIGCFDKSDHKHRLSLIRLFCVVYPVVAFVIFVIARKPVLLVRIGGLAQAVTLPMIAISALYFRYRRCEPGLRPSLLWDCFLLLSVVSLIAAGGIAVFRILTS